MKQKGMTLTEVVVCLMIVSFLSLSVKGYGLMIENLRFNQLELRIESGIHSAQQMAWLRQVAYKIGYNEGRIYIRDNHEIFYSIPIQSHIDIKIADRQGLSTKTREVAFVGDLSPSSCGTITLDNKKLHKVAQITVRPATGKTARYTYKY